MYIWIVDDHFGTQVDQLKKADLQKRHPSLLFYFSRAVNGVDTEIYDINEELVTDIDMKSMDILIMDYQFGEGEAFSTGTEMLARLRNIGITLPTILYTRHAIDAEYSSEVLKQLRSDVFSIINDPSIRYLVKSSSVDDLLNEIEDIIRDQVSVNLPSKFVFRQMIGRGGFSAVWEGHDTVLERPVAIKVLDSNVSIASLSEKRMHREAQLMASLDHPNIARVYEAELRLKPPYIVMELIDGSPLELYLREIDFRLEEINGYQDKLKLLRLIKLIVQISNALELLHFNDIVHRDLKPANIMVTPSCDVKLIDFGIAKTLDPSLSNEFSFIGTVRYCSPEQAARGDVDSRSDIFSFGLVSYEMLTGYYPFTSSRFGSPASVIRRILHEKPIFAPSLKDIIFDGDELLRIYARVLSTDPVKRYQTASDFTSELLTCLKVEHKLYKRKSRPRQIKIKVPLVTTKDTVET